MLLLGALALTACSGDGDDVTAESTVPSSPATTLPETTEPPPTEPPTTTSTTAPPTTEAPATTVDIEALKAQIAEDYVATEQAREELTRSPRLDGLEARVLQVAAAGSYSAERLSGFVQELVANGERIVAGSPDYSDVVAVEDVALLDGSHEQADVTACLVSNQSRVGPDGVPVGGTGVLQAARILQPMVRTADGWRQSGQPTGLWIEEGATSCPPG